MGITTEKRKTKPSPKGGGQAMKTIAFLANDSGGMYHFRRGVMRALRRRGFLVVVVAPQSHFTGKLLAEGFLVEPLRMNLYSKNPLAQAWLFFRLWKLLGRLRPHLVFTYTFKLNVFGTWAAFLRGIPTFAVLPGLGFLKSDDAWGLRKLAHLLYRMALACCQKVWFLNQGDLTYFEKHHLVSKDKAQLLYSEGINLRHFRPRQEEPMPGKTIFLMAGRLLREKGVYEFVEAARRMMARHAQVEFQLLGFVETGHPHSVQVSDILQWQEENVVRYLGETEDVRPFLARADCVVLPSYFGEGMSRILMEAASMARPIVTTLHEGCQEVVEEGKTGLLCRTKDVAHLVEKLEAFLQLSPEARKQMGRKGRSKMRKEFREERIIQHYVTAITQTLSAEETTKSQATLPVSMSRSG